MNDREGSLDSRLDRIREKLRRLRDLDPSFAVRGAEIHQYRLGKALTDREVAGFEERLGITLPMQYRLFVTQVGHGGAGPNCGLFTLDGSDSQNLTSPEQIQRPFRWTHAFDPRQLGNSASPEDVWRDEDCIEADETPSLLNVPGALYICDAGCNLRLFLVVQGESVGEVWFDKQADEEGVFPECGDDGKHLSFLDWYERWLDKAPKQIPIAKIGRKSGIPPR